MFQGIGSIEDAIHQHICCLPSASCGSRQVKAAATEIMPVPLAQSWAVLHKKSWNQRQFRMKLIFFLHEWIMWGWVKTYDSLT
jgi:uncharacterized membrane protein